MADPLRHRQTNPVIGAMIFDTGSATSSSAQVEVFSRGTLVFLLYQKGRDSRIFQAQDRAIDDFT
jgi:hypothetical protein